MTEMTEPRDLFLHELGDILYAERTLVKALPKLKKEASDEELAQAFGDHLRQTKQHVANVEDGVQGSGREGQGRRSARGSTASSRSTTSSSRRSRPRRRSSTRS